jgi:DNA-binding response OmpR family regulator
MDSPDRTDRRGQRGGRQPLLVVGAEAETAQPILHELRRLGRTAVWVDTAAAAVEMAEAVAFALVLVIVDQAGDWTTCWRLTRAAPAPVAVLTRFLSPDRRYRRRAFAAGVVGYACQPCGRLRLRALLRRNAAGETQVELVEGARFTKA